MHKIFSMAMACIMMLSCLCTNAGAIDKMFDDQEVLETVIMRVSGSFNMSIEAYGKSKADTVLPLEAGETVTIKASYSPFSASVDFGLIDSDNIFHYVNVTNGSIDKTIEVPESGNYTLAIRNNSGNTVKVSGFVKY